MSSVSRYSDEHTMYVTSGAATNADLKSSVLRALKKLEKESRERIPCDILCNLIYDREGVPYGFGYLYVSNPRVYHMLLGRNPDGSERTKIVEKDLDYLAFPEGEMPWFDWADAAEEIELIREPPLLQLPSFYYTPDQQQLLQKFLTKLELSEKPHFRPEEFDPYRCTFQLDVGLVKAVDEKFSTNILCTRDIPPWLTERDLYKRFQSFCSDKERSNASRARARGRNQKTKSVYPLITINPRKQIAFVEFDSKTRDAQFALLMTTKVIFVRSSSSKNKCRSRAGRDTEVESETLIFTHAYKPKPGGGRSGYFKRK